MSKNSKNSSKGAANSFAVLGNEDDGCNDKTKSSRGRPLKRTQPFEPDSPPPPKKPPTSKTKVTSTPTSTTHTQVNQVDTSSGNPLLRVEALLARVESALVASEQRAERAEKRLENLEECIRNELLPRLSGLPANTEGSSASSTVERVSLPPSPPSSPIPRRIPGIGLDLSRAANKELRDGNAATVRNRANEALKDKGITCLGVNSKGNGRYRLLFNQKDIEHLRRDDKWVQTHFDKGTVYGDQWFPVRIDRACRKVAMDELGCSVLGRLNGVKVHKMRWLGTVSVDKEYSSMVVHLDTKEEADRLLEKITVLMPNGECAYTRPFYPSVQPPRCYRCHLYGHLHYRCQAPTPVCGQCAQPGHSASVCTSTDFKCAACGGKGPHKATDPGCPVYRRELAKLRSSPSY